MYNSYGFLRFLVVCGAAVLVWCGLGFARNSDVCGCMAVVSYFAYSVLNRSIVWFDMWVGPVSWPYEKVAR